MRDALRDAATAIVVGLYLALGAWLELVARAWPGAPAIRWDGEL